MLFEDISYLEHWFTFCSAQPKILCNFSRGHYEEHFFEMILNLIGPVVKEEMPFKDISYLELWWLLCSGERNHLFIF